ncbi:recombinase family protein [Oscillibacter sp.]|uniref:recombinase family protein n=1 Tax=Oscillibacter sp. TaxID=1945593 RepID=UPI00289F2775|nr:recombinase family protein [Oscillibacter sp.]
MPDEYRIAAAYIRVSTEDQTELSPASQLVEIRKWAAKNGWIIPEEYVFVDEGISGRKVTGRGAFRHLIGTAKLKPKPFDAILLWKFSRFARNRDDAVFYKSVLRKQLHIEVLSISEPIAEGKLGILMEALIEAMDEYYSINLAEEVKRGMEEKHRRGELQSNPSFGYTVQDNVLAPKEPEATYIKEIFRRFSEGEGFFHIAKWLNDIGARTHRGNLFENRTVEYILRNPVYIGKLRWNPSGITRRDFTDPAIVLADGKHEPLIDMDTWNIVQSRIAELKATWKYHGRPLGSNKDWISGLIHCSSCGATLIFAKPNYWKCNHYVRGRCKTSQHVSTDLLKEAIIRRLQVDLQTSSPIQYEIIRAKDVGEDELNALRTQRDSLAKKLDRLRDAYLAGADTVEEYKTTKESTQARLADVNTQIQAAEKKSAKIGTPTAMKKSIRSVLKTITSDSTTMEQKSEAAHSIIEYATWDKAQNLLQIHYRLVF